MQTATILSLAASVTCVGLFIKQKNWILAAAFIFSTAFTVLDKVVHVSAIPGAWVIWLAYLFFALLAYEVLQKVVLK